MRTPFLTTISYGIAPCFTAWRTLPAVVVVQEIDEFRRRSSCREVLKVGVPMVEEGGGGSEGSGCNTMSSTERTGSLERKGGNGGKGL
jgi:hypothetical protein